MAFVKRVIEVGAKSMIYLSRSGGTNAGSTINKLGVSPNCSRWLSTSSSGQSLPKGKAAAAANADLLRQLEALGVATKDAKFATSAMLRQLEAKGLAPKDAETVISQLTEVLGGNGLSEAGSKRVHKLSKIRSRLLDLHSDINTLNMTSEETSPEWVDFKSKMKLPSIMLLVYVIPCYLLWALAKRMHKRLLAKNDCFNDIS